MQAQTQTATLNPNNNQVSQMLVTNTNHDMFCPGISMLGSGDIVVTGGDNAEKTSIYSPAKGAWLPGPDMNVKRGYQASATLSSGDVRSRTLRTVLLTGSRTYVCGPERLLQGACVLPMRDGVLHHAAFGLTASNPALVHGINSGLWASFLKSILAWL